MSARRALVLMIAVLGAAQSPVLAGSSPERGNQARAAAVGPATNKADAVDATRRQVVVAEPGIHTGTSLTVDSRTSAFAIDPVFNRVYVRNLILNRTTATTPDGTNLQFSTVAFGHGPWAIAVSSASNRISCGLVWNSAVIGRATQRSRAVESKFSLGAMAVNPATPATE